MSKRGNEALALAKGKKIRSAEVGESLNYDTCNRWYMVDRRSGTSPDTEAVLRREGS